MVVDVLDHFNFPFSRIIPKFPPVPLYKPSICTPSLCSVTFCKFFFLIGCIMCKAGFASLFFVRFIKAYESFAIPITCGVADLPAC